MTCDCGELLDGALEVAQHSWCGWDADEVAAELPPEFDLGGEG